MHGCLGPAKQKDRREWGSAKRKESWHEIQGREVGRHSAMCHQVNCGKEQSGVQLLCPSIVLGSTKRAFLYSVFSAVCQSAALQGISAGFSLSKTEP